MSFEPRSWHEGMSDKESKDLAYWERNMLALRYADGWYNDDVVLQKYWECPETGQVNDLIIGPRFEGWRRVLSLENGTITFHIPDDFDVGNLPQIDRNWDGHTTEEKWRRVWKWTQKKQRGGGMKRYEDCENCHWLTCKKEDLEHRLDTLLTALKKHGIDRWHYEDCEYNDEDIETCDCGGKELARIIADCDHKTPDKKTELPDKAVEGAFKIRDQ